MGVVFGLQGSDDTKSTKMKKITILAILPIAAIILIFFISPNHGQRVYTCHSEFEERDECESCFDEDCDCDAGDPAINDKPCYYAKVIRRRLRQDDGGPCDPLCIPIPYKKTRNCRKAICWPDGPCREKDKCNKWTKKDQNPYHIWTGKRKKTKKRGKKRG